MQQVYVAALSACAMLAACTQQEAADVSRERAAVQESAAIAFEANPAERRALFGDLHLHTSYSLDAAASHTNTTPDDAYRYAQGEEIDYLGQRIQRHAPLDFLAVTDHAEFLGNVRAAMAGEIVLPGDQADWQRQFESDGGPAMFEFFRYVAAGLRGETLPGLQDPGRSHDTWMDTIAAAERHYRPGRFTSFVAFEYSPTSQSDGGHLHRNVIFRGPHYPAMPFAATDSTHPEALWAYAENNRLRGIESLMIPHNSNLSSGGAFAFADTYGEPIGPEYARRRARNEPLVEITQNKGTSETLPLLSPDDEFADFELLYSPDDNEPAGSYVRSGLQRGMQLDEDVGINPFEFGFVGASDFHSGASSSEEDNFPGGLGLSDAHRDTAQILQELSPILGRPLANLSASGLTGVWAEENTREAIFAAMQRRETFATSGPRMQVRLFAGWGGVGDWVERGDWAAAAYRWGVPMGGNLTARPGGASPSLIVQAVKDPASGNLDRIQIVKLWREGGRSMERIYDVAWSDGRSIGADGRLEPVGNTVDAATATYSNTIGAAELFTTWTDPDFDPSQRAIYYARVLEIPTPRWATYLSVASGIPLSDATPAWLQERAWSSPVWYRP